MAEHLTIWERERISQSRAAGVRPSVIARELKRHRSTITRELQRNSESTGYFAISAQRKADERRRHRPHKMDDPELNEYVRRGLANYWSPDQIAGRSRWDFPRRRERQVSRMTIYRWIQQDEDREHWETFLRFGRRRQQPERRGKLPACAQIAGRPDVVDRRARFGDWEGDTIVGARRQSGIVTLVERKSGYLVAGVVRSLRARNVRRSIQRRFAPAPRGLRHTMTFDNGKEFAEHALLARHTGLDVYFARPYHAWERGANENLNGLLRQFLPKGTDFKRLSPRELQYIQKLLNERPRQRHGYRTPREVMAAHFGVAFEM